MKNYFKRMTIFLIIQLLLIYPKTLHAQKMPVVLIQETNKTESIPLRMNELEIDIKVVGNIAVTTMIMNFHNDLDRDLEGKLYFPLGEGQTVSRFAMSVSGKLREGVVVEKEKGRVVFESIVRQKIDPGLLEWTKGNNFKARIYPIPARGDKKIVVAYEHELRKFNDNYLYLLPLQFVEKVDIFSIRVEVFKQEITPILDSNQIENFQFKKRTKINYS